MISKKFSLDRDIDYCLYSIFKVLLYLGIFITFLMLLSIYTNFHFFVSTKDFEINKPVFISTFSMLMGSFSIVITIYFYLRVRLRITLKKTPIVCISNDELVDRLKQKGKKTWLRWSLVNLLGGLFIILAAHIFPIGLLRYLNMEDSTFFTFLINCVPIFVIPFGATIFIYGCLMFEKIIRYFPIVKEEYGITSLKN